MLLVRSVSELVTLPGFGAAIDDVQISPRTALRRFQDEHIKDMAR